MVFHCRPIPEKVGEGETTKEGVQTDSPWQKEGRQIKEYVVMWNIRSHEGEKLFRETMEGWRGVDINP